MLLADSLVLLKELRAQNQVTKSWNRHLIFLICIDCIIQVTAMVFFRLNHAVKGQSGPKTENFIGQIMGLAWADQSQGFEQKKKSFLAVFSDLIEVMAFASVVEGFGMSIALIIFVRLVSATDAHPKIALITSTIKLAASDMVHFFLIFLMVLFGIAVIGSWRFGSESAEFRSVLAAMRTQFDAVLDPPGEIPVSTDSDTDFEYLAFVLLIHVVNFFFLINFFLAIVVNAYTNVRRVEDCTVEQSVFADFFALLRNFTKRASHRWPTEAQLIQTLKGMQNECLTSVDLSPSLFHSEDSAQAFIDYYLRFDFLHSSAMKHKLTTMDVLAAQRNLEVKLNTLLSRLRPNRMARRSLQRGASSTSDFENRRSLQRGASSTSDFMNTQAQPGDTDYLERKFAVLEGFLHRDREVLRDTAARQRTDSDRLARLEDHIGMQSVQVAKLLSHLEVLPAQRTRLESEAFGV